MKVTRLALHAFTVFDEDTTFDLAPGVNVLIGANGTGKSHVLKLIYALTEAARRFAAGQGLEDGMPATLEHVVQGMLMGVFLPDSLQSFCSSSSSSATTISLTWEDARLDVELFWPRGLSSAPGRNIKLTASATGDLSKVGKPPPLFIPPREVLSIFPGFVEAWLHRESAFDRTYFDLCVALGLKLLRNQAGLRALLDPIEHELGGKVVMREGRFYLDYPGGEMEMPMVAEGDRKLAMIAYLLMNGSLSDNACLLWDEPEANLNPKRARLTGDTIAALAHAGVQVLLATHDYALTSELSLKVDTGALRAGEAAFFALHRDELKHGVFVDRGARLADLQDNAILDALADLHMREQSALFGSTEEPR